MKFHIDQRTDSVCLSLIYRLASTRLVKVHSFFIKKVVPYPFVRRGVPVREDTYPRAVTTIFILGGLEVTIRGGLTMIEAEELKNLF